MSQETSVTASVKIVIGSLKYIVIVKAMHGTGKGTLPNGTVLISLWKNVPVSSYFEFFWNLC